MYIYIYIYIYTYIYTIWRIVMNIRWYISYRLCVSACLLSHLDVCCACLSVGCTPGPVSMPALYLVMPPA